MADFNAGSIEGTLDLDLTPFEAGLRRARQQADEFERRKITAQADLDSAQFTEKKDRLGRDLDRLNHEKVSARADLDISEAVAKYEVLQKILSKGFDAGGLGKSLTGLAGGAVSSLLKPAALLSIAAAAGPATAAVTGFGAAASVAFAGAGVALGLFAKVAGSDFAKIQAASKKGLTLTGPAGEAQKALSGLSKAWDTLQQKTAKPVFNVMTTAFSGLAGLLPRLVPLVDTTAKGIGGIVSQVLALTHTHLFGDFLTELQSFMHGFLGGAGPVLSNLLQSFMHIFIAIQPILAMLGRGILAASQDVEKFSEKLDGSGVKPFVSYMQTELPILGHLITDVFSGLVHLGQGLAPLSGPAISFIDGLVKAIGRLNLGPISHGLGDLLDAMKPLLPVAAAIINTFLTPMGHLLTDIAHNAVGPLAQSLGANLHPALSDLKKILAAIEPPLAQFITSIANLANPTGVGFITTLLNLLVKPVQILAPAIGNLASALESVVDSGLKTFGPLLSGLKGPLDGAATGVAALVNGLAAVLRNKGVAVTLFSIVAGIKGIKLAIAGYDAVVGAFTAVSVAVTHLKDMCILTRIELALLKAQEILAAATSAIITGAMWALSVGIKAVSVAVEFCSGVAKALWAVMAANPVGAVIAIIALLVVGVIYAYKHFTTFRNIVNDCWHAIVTASEWAWNNILQPVLSNLVNAFGHVFVAIGTVLQGLGHFVPGAKAAGDAMVAAGHAAEDMASHINKIGGEAAAQTGPVRLLAAALDSLHSKTVTINTVRQTSYLSKIVGMSSAGGWTGGLVKKFAGGGDVWGAGTGTSDQIPAMLSNGEFVVNAGATAKHRELLSALNADSAGAPSTRAPASLPSLMDSRVTTLLMEIAHYLSRSMPEDTAKALGDTLSKHADDTARRALQSARAA